MKEIIIVILSLFTCFSTYYLQKLKRFDAVRASSLVTVIISLFIISIGQALGESSDLYVKAIFGASFVGMCSYRRFDEFLLLAATVIYIGLFVYVLDLLPYPGGALGFLVFLSFAVIILLRLFTRYIGVNIFFKKR